MKTLKFVGIAMLIFSAGLFISCGNKSHKHDHDQTEASSENQGKEHTSKYVCPMHCEGSGSEAAGECPVCGMDYVRSEEHTRDGHKH